MSNIINNHIIVERIVYFLLSPLDIEVFNLRMYYHNYYCYTKISKVFEDEIKRVLFKRVRLTRLPQDNYFHDYIPDYTTDLWIEHRSPMLRQFQTLCTYRRLRSLEIVCCCMDQWEEGFIDLPLLRVLRVSTCGRGIIGKSLFVLLKGCKNILELDVRFQRNEIVPFGLETIHYYCPRLKSFSIHARRIEKTFFDSVTGTQLEHISISGCLITDGLAEYLKRDKIFPKQLSLHGSCYYGDHEEGVDEESMLRLLEYGKQLEKLQVQLIRPSTLLSRRITVTCPLLKQLEIYTSTK